MTVPNSNAQPEYGPENAVEISNLRKVYGRGS